MRFHLENTSPNEEKMIRAWLAVLADELDIARSNYSVHVRISPMEYGVARMIPIPTPDKRLFVELNIERSSEWLPALSHEMVHVKQVVKGEQVVADPETGLAYWIGQRYNIFACNAAAEGDYEFYRSLPWEIEAHGRMWALARRVRMRTAQ